MLKRIVFLAGLISLFLTAGAWADSKEMLFHAGVGQRAALNEIKAVFEKDHPDIKVNFSYKGSGYFIADITRSKQGDLFMPGEEFYLLQAVERGFIDDYDPKTDIPAYFVTVIITPKGNPANITKIEDFAKPGVRVGLGKPQGLRHRHLAREDIQESRHLGQGGQERHPQRQVHPRTGECGPAQGH